MFLYLFCRLDSPFSSSILGFIPIPSFRPFLSLCVYCNVHLSFISLTVSAKFLGEVSLERNSLNTTRRREEEEKQENEEWNWRMLHRFFPTVRLLVLFSSSFLSSFSLSPSYMCLQSLNMRQENRRRMCSVSDEREPLENCSFPFEANTISFSDSDVCEDGDEGTAGTRISLTRSRIFDGEGGVRRVRMRNKSSRKNRKENRKENRKQQE